MDPVVAVVVVVAGAAAIVGVVVDAFRSTRELAEWNRRLPRDYQRAAPDVEGW